MYTSLTSCLVADTVQKSEAPRIRKDTKMRPASWLRCNVIPKTRLSGEGISYILHLNGAKKLYCKLTLLNDRASSSLHTAKRSFSQLLTLFIGLTVLVFLQTSEFFFSFHFCLEVNLRARRLTSLTFRWLLLLLALLESAASVFKCVSPLNRYVEAALQSQLSGTQERKSCFSSSAATISHEKSFQHFPCARIDVRWCSMCCSVIVRNFTYSAPLRKRNLPSTIHEHFNSQLIY